MSSTIHSFGPKPASGLSCGLVAWVDTGGIASSTVTVQIRRPGYAPETILDSRTWHGSPRSVRYGSGDVALAHDQRADDAGDHAVGQHHDATDPVFGRLREQLGGRDQ